MLRTRVRVGHRAAGQIRGHIGQVERDARPGPG